MALGKRYTSTFLDRLGREVEVQLWKEGYVGDPDEFNLDTVPLLRDDSAAESDPLFPLRPSVVTINLPFSQSAVQDAVYADAVAWQVRVLVDSAEDFRGPLVRNIRTQSLDDYGQGFTLTAICGLGDLQDLPFLAEVEADAITREYKTRAGWIIYLLDKIGLGFSLYTHSNFFAVGMIAGDPLAQEYLNAQTWTYDKDARRTCYDVLVDLLAGLGLVLHQKSGAWHCLQRRAFAGTSLTRYVYASGSAGTSGTSSSYDTIVEATNPQVDRLSGGILESSEPYALASVIYNHGVVANLVPNGGLQSGGLVSPTPGTFFPSWDNDGFTRVAWQTTSSSSNPFQDLTGLSIGEAAEVIRRWNRQKSTETAIPRIAARAEPLDVVFGEETESDFLAQLDAGPTMTMSTPTEMESSGVDGLLVVFQCTVEMAEGVPEIHMPTTFTVWATVTYTVGETVYYLRRIPRGLRFSASDPEWVTDEAKAGFLVTGDTDTEFAIEAPSITELGDGELEVTLNSVLDYTSATPFPNLAKYLYWHGVQVVPKVSGEDTAHEATQSFVAVNGVAGREREPLVVMNGTGPTTSHPGCTKSSSNGLLNDWGLGVQDGDPSDITLAQLMGKDILMMTRTSYGIINAVYSSSVEPSPILAIKEGSKHYLPVACSKDYKRVRTQVRAHEIRLDGFTADYSSLADDAVGSFNGVRGEGTAAGFQAFEDYVGIFSTHNDLTTTDENLTGEISAIPVATISSEQAVLAAGNFIAIAGLNGGFWEFQIATTPVAPINSIAVVTQDIGDAIIPSGSGVYPGTGSLVSVQTQTRNVLFSSVQSGAFATLTADVDGAAITSLPVSSIPWALADGWELEIGPSTDPDFLGDIFTVTVDGGESAAATSIAIDSAEVRCKSGDPVKVTSVQMVTELLQNASTISATATLAGENETAIAGLEITVGEFGAEVILSATHEGGGVYSIGLFSLGAGPGGSIAKIAADQIQIDGTTTFSSGYDPSEKETPDGAQAKADDAQTAAEAAAEALADAAEAAAILAAESYADGVGSGIVSTYSLGALGDVAYEDVVEAALLGNTVISGGYLLTSLIDVNTLFAETIVLTGSISSNNYSSGTAGWIITSSGMEINDVTVRGTLDGVGGTFTNLTVDGSGGGQGIYSDGSAFLGGVSLDGGISAVANLNLSATDFLGSSAVNITAININLSVSGDGAKVNGNSIWHEGNFDPDDYLLKSDGLTTTMKVEYEFDLIATALYYRYKTATVTEGQITALSGFSSWEEVA